MNKQRNKKGNLFCDCCKLKASNVPVSEKIDIILDYLENISYDVFDKEMEKFDEF